MRCAAAVAVFALVAGSAVSQELPPVAPIAAAPLPFDDWLLALRSEAAGRGIRAEILDRALTGVLPVEQILERDRSQAEFTLNLEVYLRRRLTRDTVRTAQKMYSEHGALLQRVAKAFGVSPRIVVAVWGLESNFGRFAGVRPTIPALITLAYDPRRGADVSQRALQCARDPEPRRHRAREPQGIVGRGARPAAVHAVELPAVRRRFRRRRAARHLVIASGRVRVGRVLPAAARMDGRADVGTRGQDPGRGARPGGRGAAARDRVPRRADDDGPAPLRTWRRMGLRTVGGGALPSSTSQRIPRAVGDAEAFCSTRTTMRCWATTAPTPMRSAWRCWPKG